MLQSQHLSTRQYQYTPRTNANERPLHWLTILLALLFVFLLIIESVAFIVLGAWHLTIPRLRDVLAFSNEIYRRELAFGILLVIIGSLGMIISIFGLVAFFTLRLPFLKIFSICLWFMMVIGLAVGIIGIVFASQVDDFKSSASNNSNINESKYAEEKFMLGMNGGLSLFMSLTLVAGIIIVRCLATDDDAYANIQSYVRTK